MVGQNCGTRGQNGGSKQSSNTPRKRRQGPSRADPSSRPWGPSSSRPAMAFSSALFPDWGGPRRSVVRLGRKLPGGKATHGGLGLGYPSRSIHVEQCCTIRICPESMFQLFFFKKKLEIYLGVWSKLGQKLPREVGDICAKRGGMGYRITFFLTTTAAYVIPGFQKIRTQPLRQKYPSADTKHCSLNLNKL